MLAMYLNFQDQLFDADKSRPSTCVFRGNVFMLTHGASELLADRVREKAAPA